jgi:hypothetical protein
MKAKEKAKELVNKYSFLNEIFIPSIHEQKKCALIAVNEILKEKNGCSKYECYGQDINWEKVKKKIEKL